MRALRRHVLYASQEHETSVGDTKAKASVLRLWLDRRRQFLNDDAVLTRFLTLFWTLAKPTHATSLAKQDYVAFFQCVAKALVQSVGLDHAARVAARDWLYDCAGGADEGHEDDGDQAVMSMEQFREALFQCADLVLPVESDASMFASFFQELRDAIATPPAPQQRENTQEELAAWPVDALGFRLRALKDVAKIRGAFLQKMPPNADHLAQIRGLASPDMDAMSLKQLLLSYNPRKFALSRTFSSLFAPTPASAAAPVAAPAPEENERWQLMEEDEEQAQLAPPPPPVVSLLETAPLLPSQALSRESDDAFDLEDATVASMETFPALRLAVVGPPGAGKSRVAASLAQRLGLQYISTAMAVEDAFASKLVRKAAREERQREKAEAREAAAAAVAQQEAEAQADPGKGDGEPPESIPAESERAPEDEEEPVDEADVIFGDAELAALQSGEALPREKALPILMVFARRSLLRGVGVVLDDVFPNEADGITLDYVVSLEMAQEDARDHVTGFTLAPTSKRVYSARERAMLSECDIVLREQGLSDSYGFVEPWEVDSEVSREDGGLEQRRARVADALAAAHAALAAAKVKPPGEGEEGAEAEAEGEAPPSPTGDNSGEDTLAETAPETTLPLSPAQRNEIEPSDEPTVPLKSLLVDGFTTRYRAFEARASGLTSTTRTQVIAVVAAQALSDIVTQCIVAITNNSLGISRAATSRAVLPITLPEEIATSGSRADQLRWLLYGDWTDALADVASLTPFAPGPVDPQQPRTLSRWRDCCVVSSSQPAASPVLGDPQFAAYYSGHVYLFASHVARESFCAAPLQYVRRRPPSLPSARKLWIISSESLDSDTANALAELVRGDHVSATEALASRHSVQHLMELMEGKPLAPTSEVATVVADLLCDKPAWVLTDLIPSKEVLDTLRERGCLPDAIVCLSVDDADAANVLPSALARKKYELFAASYLNDATAEDAPNRLTELLTEMQLLPSLRVLRSTLRPAAGDTRAALFRPLSPLAPRVDSSDDGTKREPTEAEEEHARVFGPVAEEATEDEPLADGENLDETKTKPLVDPLGYDTKRRAWVANRARMGESAQSCAVTWAMNRVLVPGQPSFVASFQQKLYAFAGEKELAAFERNPTQYVPSAPRATQCLVPVVWLLGVRGSDADALARSTAEAFRGARVGVLDDAAVARRVERRLRAQLLLPVDKQTSLPDAYVDELSKELTCLTTSGVWDVVLVVNVSLAGVRVPTQLEEDPVDEVPPPSPLPTPELLALCFERDVFPTLVLSLEAPEEVIVQRQLAKWRDALLPARPPRKAVTTEGDAADPEDSEAVDPAELEAAEVTRLQELFQSDQEALSIGVETLRARGLALERPVRVDATPRAVVNQLSATIKTLLVRKDSLFEYCERVSVDHAQRLLRSGQVVMGKHAMRCPITGKSPLPTACALVYRGRLYFPQSAPTLTQCEHAPAAWLVDTPSQPPQCRVTCCVVGPPCVGKTQLARKIAIQWGLTYVSPRSAIAWVHQCLAPASNLSRKLQQARSDGIDDWRKLDAALVHEVIYTRLCGADCQRNGWVLDDYIATPEQLARCLDDQTRQVIHPGVVFVLEGSIEHAWRNARDANRERLCADFAGWNTRHRLELLHTWTRTFGAFHVRQIDADASSAWQVHAQASAVLHQHAAAIRQYIQGVSMERPVRMLGVVRTQRALEAQAHDVFQSFCPVQLSLGKYHTTLAHQRELCVECVDTRNAGRRIALWLANGRNRDTFCSSHVAYLTEESVTRAKELVEKSPVDASLLSLLSVADCEFPEMKGYCPVTFQRGTGDKDWQAIVKGSVFFRVSYEGKAFFCLSERKRRAFITQPGIYAALVLPIKLPPQLTASTAFKSCPGRIEQELSGVLNETLLLLGATRPKFLGVSASASACVYVALLLKTRATKALPDHIRARYAEQLQAFERDCRLGEQLKALILPNTTTSRGSGIKGARAVRELSASTSEADLQRAYHPEDEVGSADALRARFDELVTSARLEKGTSANQQRTTPRANDAFHSYTAPVMAKTNGNSVH